MIIKVTQSHIDNGARDSASDSPLALALKEVFPGKIVIVAPTKFRVGDKTYNMPYEPTEQEHRFDKGEKIEPYEFEFYP